MLTTSSPYPVEILSADMGDVSTPLGIAQNQL